MEWSHSARIFSSHGKRTKQLAEMMVCYSESGSGKGGPPPPEGDTSFGWMHCAAPDATPYAETRHPVSPGGETFSIGPIIPKSTRLYSAERAHQQAKRLLTTTSGRHLEDTALLPPPKNRIPPQRERLWNNFRHQAAFPLDEWHP